MRKIFILVIIFAFCAPSLTLAADSSAPMSFYGQAELNGTSLPAGSVVQVLVAGALVGKSTVNAAGYYNEADYAKSRLIVSPYKGSALVFKYISQETDGAYLGDTVVKYLGPFEAGKNVKLDLPFVFNASLSFIPVTATTAIADLYSHEIQLIYSKTQVLGEKVIDYSAFSNLTGLSGELANAVSLHEAETIYGQKEVIVLSAGNTDLYNKVVAAHLSEINEANKNVLAYFIQTGTPTTKRLGAGELAGALS